MKIRSETKELSSRSVDELRGAEKGDLLKKTKNVQRDTSGRRVVEPKERGTAYFHRESKSGRPLNTYIVPIVKNSWRFRRNSIVPIVLCLGTAISLYILHNSYAN